ncbi:Nonribosomal Peptide Synthase (NRPS) [Aspergillus melleus]|uniref:Nonribosomal Peptide Synthase (NRPS) n=1 Tax=Aspergillus melleus TaxID=138277 RepID=A0ACC3B0Y6_9EURO|nr:Nonribosomal Peptide Synthase (NRPS) [Aspergillus melleus]
MQGIAPCIGEGPACGTKHESLSRGTLTLECQEDVLLTLPNGAQKSVHWATIELPRLLGRQVYSISNQHCHFYVAALWALILRHYTDCLSAQLWLSILASKSDTELPDPQIITAQPTDETTFASLSEETSWSAGVPGGVEQPNTGIIAMADTPVQSINARLVDRDLHPLSKMCDIVLALQTTHEGLRVWLLYRESFLSTTHASAIVEKLVNLTASVSTNLRLRLRDLWLISNRDLHQLRRWNSRSLGTVPTGWIQEIVHRRALDQPHKTAIVASDGTIGYEQLDRLSSCMASELARRGVGPNVFVPLSFRKSLWAVVALLAVNKTGAAFVPLDASAPIERLTRIIQRTGAKVVLACNQQAEILRNSGVSAIPAPGLVHYQAGDEAGSNLPTPDATAAAYCLFTSGSTGEPKGCLVSHGAFASIAGHCDALSIHSESRVLQFASFSFGMSLIEIFCTLCSGGTVCIPSERDRVNSLAEVITTMKVTWTVLSPTTLGTLSPGEVAGLQTIVVGGEPILEGHVALWAPHVQLLYSYGLTECCGVVTVSNQILSSDPMERTIGYPVAGGCWIVDPTDVNRLRPIGAVGELLIAGPSLAQGYFHDAEKTALSFIGPPAWMTTPSPAYLYRTGDLARFNPDGSVAYLGRKDHQLKIRGQRIDGGELEHQLSQLLPNVEDVVVDVVVPTGSSGIPTLVAFIIQQRDDPTDADANAPILLEPTSDFLQAVQRAKQDLGNMVPQYMIPTVFLLLGSMPRTVSGKKDRRRLRQEAAQMTWQDRNRYTVQQNADTTTVAAPEEMTEPERILALIWAQLLHLDVSQINPNDDFQTLGGDSITAMRVVAMARGKDIELTVSDMFTFPRLGDLARSITGTPRPTAASSPAVHLVEEKVVDLCISHLRKQPGLLDGSSGERPAVLPATGMQRFFLDRCGFDYFRYTLEGALDIGKLQQACNAVITRHAILRTIFTQNDYGLFQVIPSTVLATPFHHVTTAGDLDAVCEAICTAHCLDMLLLDRVVIQFILISKHHTPHHSLIIRLSHAQYDALSFPVILQDLAAAYDGAELAPAPQFTDYCNQAQQVLAAGYDFWRRYLLDGAVTPLRVEWSSPSATSSEISKADEVEARIRLTPSPQPPGRITLATLVKAAWALVLGQQTGNTDIIFGQTVNGRSGMSLAGIETILGPCTNFLPIRVRLRPGQTAEDFLCHVQNQHMHTTQYDYMEYSQIVERSTPWRGPARLGSIVHHQNVDTQFQIPFRSIRTTTGASYVKQRLQDTFIYSLPDGNNLELRLLTPANVMNKEEADKMLREMVTMMEQLVDRPDQALGLLMSR